MADLWAVMASFGQEACAEAYEVPSAPEMHWEAHNTESSEQPQIPINQTTSVYVMPASSAFGHTVLMNAVLCSFGRLTSVAGSVHLTPRGVLQKLGCGSFESCRAQACRGPYQGNI